MNRGTTVLNSRESADTYYVYDFFHCLSCDMTWIAEMDCKKEHRFCPGCREPITKRIYEHGMSILGYGAEPEAVARGRRRDYSDENMAKTLFFLLKNPHHYKEFYSNFCSNKSVTREICFADYPLDFLDYEEEDFKNWLEWLKGIVGEDLLNFWNAQK